MGLQKYRADVLDETDANGAQLWVARFWHLYSKVVNCPTPFGPRTVSRFTTHAAGMEKNVSAGPCT